MMGIEVDIPTHDLPLKNLCEIAKEVPRNATLRRWTLRADYRYPGGSHHHATVNLSESPLYLDLSWHQTAEDPALSVGVVRLDLNGLLRDGYIRHDPEGSNGSSVRLRVFRDDAGNFYVKTNQGKGLLLAISNISPATPLAADIKDAPANRVETTTYRILRDTELARKVKLLHDYRCQICGYSIKLASGLQYAEAHHIQPLGEPHNGPDVLGNIICVCPNHHAELDYRIAALEISSLINVAGHQIDQKYVDYHNQIFSRK